MTYYEKMALNYNENVKRINELENCLEDILELALQLEANSIPSDANSRKIKEIKNAIVEKASKFKTKQ